MDGERGVRTSLAPSPSAQRVHASTSQSSEPLPDLPRQMQKNACCKQVRTLAWQYSTATRPQNGTANRKLGEPAQSLHLTFPSQERRPSTCHALKLSLCLNVTLLAFLLTGYVGPSVKTTFMPEVEGPVIGNHTRIHPLDIVIGSVTSGDRVFVAPAASVRGDEGRHIRIGNDSNVQDGVVVHGLETFEGDHELPENEVEVDGMKYSVYIGNRVSLAHQSQVHGPA